MVFWTFGMDCCKVTKLSALYLTYNVHELSWEELWRNPNTPPPHPLFCMLILGKVRLSLG